MTLLLFLLIIASCSVFIFTQFCGMMGELDVAVETLNKALPLARTRDDVHDLNQVLIMNEAQLKAVMTMKKVLNV